MNLVRRICSLIFSIVSIFLAIPTSLEAYPYAYRRLVLKQDGKIIKIVDLISDVHIPEKDIDVELLAARFEDEKSRIDSIGEFFRLIGKGKNEEAFLAELEKMGKRKDGEKITLIGESNPSSRESEADKISILALGTVSQTFYERFGAKQNKLLVYQDGDCYRAFLHKDSFGNKSEKNSDELSQEKKKRNLLEQLQSILDVLNKPIDREDLAELRTIVAHDLAQLQEKVDPETHAKMEKLWQNFDQTSLSKKLNSAREEFLKIADEEFMRIADFEMLFKILSADTRHVILYAGGFHCKNVSNMLTKEFGFALSHFKGSHADQALESWGFKWNVIKSVIKTIWKIVQRKKYARSSEQEKKALLTGPVVLAILKELQKFLPPVPARTWTRLRSYPRLS